MISFSRLNIKKIFKNLTTGRYSKAGILFIALTIILVISAAFYLQTAIGAAVDVLNGNGSMDNSTQVGTWTLQNNTGSSTWSLDTSSFYAGTGAGRLQSPTGSSLSYDSYAYYRFTANKVPVSANLNLAYRKNYYNAQPSSGNWNVTAEIWSTGTTPALLQSIPVDNGNVNVNWTNLATQNITVITNINTQYELRLHTQGKTGYNSSSYVRNWFDSVVLNVTYDATPPTVSSATAATDATVNVVFNKNVDATTAQNTANYAISPTLGTVTGAVLQADGKTVQLSTSNKQIKGTNYTVTVSNVQDLSGNVIVNNGTTNTATFTGIDSTPPQVSTATAVNGSTVNLVYNEQVDSTTAQNTANYSISPALAVTGAVLQADGKTVQLTTASQNYGTVYTVTVTNVKDTAGNIISGNNTATFTGVDKVPPTVSNTNVINDTTVDVVYSKSIDATTAQNTANYSISPSLTVSSATLQADGLTVRLVTNKQTKSTNYTITINNVLDTHGNTIAANTTTAFTGVDTTPPTVSSAISTSGTTVNVVFSEAVDSTTAQTNSNYSISPALSVTGAVLQADGKTVQLTTAGQTGGTYTLTVVNVKDTSGNVIAGNNTATFTGTPADTTPPIVTSATAGNSTRVTVVFSKTMDATTTQNLANYSITPALSVTGATLESDGKTVVLVTAAQMVGIKYTMTVVNVKDSTGNLIASAGNTATFIGAAGAANPHSNIAANTEKCATCHVSHTANGPFINAKSNISTLCYLCHDAAGQSIYDVADEFGNPTPLISHHKVPEGTQQCTDCHNPHGGKDAKGNSWPRLLQSSADATQHSGNQFCFSCHQTVQGSTSALTTANYPAAGVGHNNGSYTVNGITPFNPASGTQISCIGCHQDHGSTLSKLLKTNPSNGTTAATGNDKSFCINCHSSNSVNNRYPGAAVYNNSKHSLTTSNNTNASYPGITGQAGQCLNCHDPHGTPNGTSLAAMKTLRSPYTDIPLTPSNKGTINYTVNNFAFCFQCHNNTSANTKYNIQTLYTDNGNIKGGHYIKTAGGNLAAGSKITCEDCHSLHGSVNNNKYSMNDALGSNLGDGRNECLACHTTGKNVEGLTMSAPPSTVPQHATSDTTPCLNCHGSAHQTTLGISSGGQDCSACHSNIVNPMSSTSQNYHHLIVNSSATYSITQTNKNCLSCHVDHNKFNNSKSSNLKGNYTQSFPTTDTTPGVNTDFVATDATYGGICLSCHILQQTKSYTQADGTTATQPMNITKFNNSAHNYTVASTFGDSTTFNANCAKCHNDTLIKDKQTSTNKFGTHDSTFSSILSPFGDTTLTNPLNQKFCYKCHDGTGGTTTGGPDVYGVAMSAAAKNVYNKFTTGVSKHDITGATGAKLTCINCHNQHNTSKNPLSAGLTNSDISDPSNTLNPFITTSGNLANYCIKCHGAAVPTAVNNGTAYVPGSVLFPIFNFTNPAAGWDKSLYTSSGHYNKQYYCDKCHDEHGSGFVRLLTKGEDTTTTDGICLQCHNGTVTGAANVKTDLNSGTNSTYRHPTLSNAGLHSDTETFPQTTANRHAECVDCHDPHAANATTATGGNASGKINNVLGVTPTYPTSNSAFAAALSFTTGSVTKEYQLCLKCHSNFNGNYPTPPTGAFAETDLAKELNPVNPSFHDVGLYSGAARSYVGAFQTGSNMNGNTVLYCSSCHGSNTTATSLTASSSPVHGSTNQYILKGVWNSSTNSQTANNLCLKCHDMSNTSASSSRFNDGSSNLHSNHHQTYACQNCHGEVPHGGIRPSLLTIMSGSSYTGTYKYSASYDGVYGKNSQLYLYHWKSGGTYWNQNDCGCNGTSHG